MRLSSISLALNRPGAVSLEQVVASLFASGEQGAWYDPSAANVTWRRNLLTRTEEFGNATGWQLWNSTQLDSNAAVAPDGTTTADLLKQGNTSTFFLVGSLQSTVTVGEYYTFSVYAKDAGGRYLLMRTQTMAAPSELACIDLQDSSYTARAGVSVAIAALPNSWFRIVLTGLLTTQSATGQWQFGINQSEAVALQTYQGDGTSGIYLWGAQLERGSAATAYQRIVTPEITYLADVQSQPLLFQDSTGATPVTAVEQPVGLILDRRKGLVLGSELVTNGDFSNGTTGFTAVNGNSSGSSVVGGELNLVLSASGSGGFTQDITVVQGKTYKVSVTARRIAGSGSVRFQIYDGAAFTTLILQVFDVTTTAAAVTYTVYVRTTSTTTMRLYLYADTSTTGGFDNISVKLLDGNHAYQTGSTARPVLRARYNLLTYSEQFDNAIWSKIVGTSVTANQTAAPDSTSTADLLAATGASSNHYVNISTVSVTSGVSYTFSVYLKKGTGAAAPDWVQLIFNFAGFGTGYAVAFNVTTGAIGQSAGSITATSYTDAGNGWKRFSMTAVATSTSVSSGAGVSFSNNQNTATLQTYTAATGEDVFVWGADLRVGTSAGDYQRIAAATDYATTSTITGQPFRPYLNFDAADGTADSLFTASVDFSATDKMFFAASVQKANDTSIGTICELSATTNTNNGAFVVFASENSAPNYAFGLRGTDYGYYRATTYTAPITNVLSCVYDIAGSTSADEIKPQVNKAVPSLSFQNNVAGTGNFGNYPLYIGRRSNNSVPFTGRVFGMLIRGAATTASQVSAAEDYMAGKAGLTL